MVSTASYDNILREIASPSVNAEKGVKPEKAVPRVAVYSPKSKKPWMMPLHSVLTYAEIPYDVLYDVDEILDERLLLYDLAASSSRRLLQDSMVDCGRHPTEI